LLTHSHDGTQKKSLTSAQIYSRYNCNDAPDTWYEDCNLPPQAAQYFWWGLSSQTRRTYTTPRNDFVHFSAVRGVTPFPASEQLLALWTAKLGERGLRTKNIERYLTGLKSLHIDLGLSTEPFGNHRLQRIIRGINLFHGEPSRKECLPITRGLLICIRSLLDANDPRDANLYGDFCIAHAGFLRAGEITWTVNDLIHGNTEFAQWNLTRRSIQFEEDRLLLTLPSSETDPFRKGVTITLSALSYAACPVTAVRNLYELCPSWTPLAPLFARPPGDGPGSEAFTREYLVQHLRELLGQLGVRGAYSGHSFRRGSATSANAVGLTDHEIQLLGRWSSTAYQAYIDYHPEQVFQIARRFQNSPEHSP
jgi:hypothetical protein